MTIQAIPGRFTPTKFEKLWTWMQAIDDGFNYDPQEQLFKSHKHLNQQVERLQARVQVLEQPKHQES